MKIYIRPASYTNSKQGLHVLLKKGDKVTPFRHAEHGLGWLFKNGIEEQAFFYVVPDLAIQEVMAAQILVERKAAKK